MKLINIKKLATYCSSEDLDCISFVTFAQNKNLFMFEAIADKIQLTHPIYCICLGIALDTKQDKLIRKLLIGAEWYVKTPKFDTRILINDNIYNGQYCYESRSLIRKCVEEGYGKLVATTYKHFTAILYDVYIKQLYSQKLMDLAENIDLNRLDELDELLWKNKEFDSSESEEFESEGRYSDDDC